MARFYGQNSEILHKKCHVDIHPCYTEYIHVTGALKDVRCNVIQTKDVR